MQKISMHPVQLSFMLAHFLCMEIQYKIIPLSKSGKKSEKPGIE